MRSWIIGVSLAAALPSASLAQQEAVSELFAGPVRMSGYASGVALEWSTRGESEVDYYAVIRHAGERHGVVATFEPRGLGDSTVSYRYIDKSDFTHDLAFSVRAAFVDGTYAESERLAAQTAHSRRTRILRALDRESLASLRISLDSERDQEVVMEVRHLSGAVLERYNRTLIAGVNELEIDYANWAPGYYSVTMHDGEADLEWLVHVDPEVPTATTRTVRRRS